MDAVLLLCRNPNNGDCTTTTNCFYDVWPVCYDLRLIPKVFGDKNHNVVTDVVDVHDALAIFPDDRR